MMKLISGTELKQKLDENEDFKLIFVLGEWHYKAKHIPGSINIDDAEEAASELNKDDHIVVYCSNVSCPASVYAYNHLVNHGFNHVRRFADGIEGWEQAGYPLEGEVV